LNGIQEVVGSIPSSSTREIKGLRAGIRNPFLVSRGDHEDHAFPVLRNETALSPFHIAGPSFQLEQKSESFAHFL
jgi:hypothetical protein